MRRSNPPVYVARIIVFIKLSAELLCRLPGFVARALLPFDRRKLVVAKKLYRLGETLFDCYLTGRKK